MAISATSEDFGAFLDGARVRLETSQFFSGFVDGAVLGGMDIAEARLRAEIHLKRALDDFCPTDDECSVEPGEPTNVVIVIESDDGCASHVLFRASGDLGAYSNACGDGLMAARVREDDVPEIAAQLIARRMEIDEMVDQLFATVLANAMQDKAQQAGATE